MKVETGSLLLYAAAVAVAGYGAVTDWKYHKIYNKLTMPFIPAGMILNLILRGRTGLIESVLGLLLGFSLILLWLLGMLKAGDVKLYMAVGALGGWRFCGNTILASVIIGGIAAAFLMAARRDGRTALKRLKTYFMNLWYTRSFHTYNPEVPSAYFCYGCCIFAGSLWTFVRLLMG